MIPSTPTGWSGAIAISHGEQSNHGLKYELYCLSIGIGVKI
jgi:hypothetical protein